LGWSYYRPRLRRRRLVDYLIVNVEPSVSAKELRPYTDYGYRRADGNVVLVHAYPGSPVTAAQHAEARARETGGRAVTRQRAFASRVSPWEDL
jgi:hypothetical protein